MIPVATSTSYASPKLFSMNAMRLPSGDHDARSPKWVSRVMFARQISSGLPVAFPGELQRRQRQREGEQAA